MTDPTNPNAYDDDAYDDAGLEVRRRVEGLVETLWRTGATAGDIRDEFAAAVDDAIAEYAPRTPHQGGGPKKRRKP